MQHLRSFSLLVAFALASACAPTANVTPPAATPTPAAGATATPAPTAAPATTAPVESPGTVDPTPVASPSAAGFSWPEGKLLKAYDFKGLAGIYYESSESGLWVVDAVNDDQTPRRYMVRKFNLDGTFQAAFKLAPSGLLDPRAVTAMAFDRRGIPFYTYSDFDRERYNDDGNDRTWRLLKLVTAAVVPADRMPNNTLPRASVSTLVADNDVFTLGVLRLDPKKDVSGNRQIYYVRAEEDQQPEQIYAEPDPFEPTTLMTSAPGGLVFAAGPIRGGGFGIKRFTKDKQTTDFAKLTELPDGMWANAKGEIYTAKGSTSKPARIQKFAADGAFLGETEARLAGGGYLLSVAGMTFDPAGRALLTGKGFDALKQEVSGIYVFVE